MKRFARFKGLAPRKDDPPSESFQAWLSRVHASIPDVPACVAEHWLYRHWEPSSYEFLPLKELKFEREQWSPARISEITIGPRWGSTAADVKAIDVALKDGDPLARMMADASTWPVPIVVLHNWPDLLDGRGLPVDLWHLILVRSDVFAGDTAVAIGLRENMSAASHTCSESRRRFDHALCV